MSYRLVFDILDIDCRIQPLHLVALAVVFWLLSLAALWLTRGRRGKWIAARTIGLLALGLLVAALIYSARSYGECRAWQETLASGRAEVVEGPVTDFIPQSGEGRYSESFSVDGTAFSFTSLAYTAAYNRPAGMGGAIREGVFVRIHHVDNAILRVEVAE